jgi:hypothetical protein
MEDRQMDKTQERKIVAVALAVMAVSGACGLVLMFGHLVGFEPQWLINLALSGLPVAGFTALFSLVRA